MPQPDQLDLKPMYGWGWTGTPPNPTRETAQPFSMSLAVAEPGRWEGIASTSGHEFHGMTVAVSQRHYRWDGIVNVTVRDTERLLTEGWAEIADYAALSGKPFSLRLRLEAVRGALRHEAVLLKNRLRRG